MLALIFIIFLHITSAYSSSTPDTTSCTEQLKSNSWPTDCLLGLKISKALIKGPAYNKLNTWCALKSEILTKKSPPKVFLTLSPPLNCKKAALIKIKQDQAVQLLDGTFLNSFL